MKATQRLLYKSFFAVFLLFVVYGCQTTKSTMTLEPPVTELTSVKTQSDAENVVDTVPQTGTVVKETETAEAVATKKTKAEKELMEQFAQKFLSGIGAHGGMSQNAPGEKETILQEKPIDDSDVKSDAAEERPFINFERKLYGKWINKIETESYDFHDDGTVIIVVTGQREKTLTLNGNYKIVAAERIKIDFRNDSVASRRPPSYFKVSISENEFSLTDEPKKKGGPYGATTKYNRVE